MNYTQQKNKHTHTENTFYITKTLCGFLSHSAISPYLCGFEWAPVQLYSTD